MIKVITQESDNRFQIMLFWQLQTHLHLIGSIIKGEKQVSDVNKIGTACQVTDRTSAD